MLSPKTQYNLRNAKDYFEEHLCVGDYYCEGERIRGKWVGKGAELLRLSDDVGRDEFLALCENLDPRTGELLTQRRKTSRLIVAEGEQKEVANRRVFYDFTLSPPKSVSILALAGGDKRIVEAHERAVLIAMRELEQFAATRVRRAGAFTDRLTENSAAAIFRHETSRALDPHIHSHCIVFNATHDGVEGRWKALQNFEMLRAQKYVENVYYHELARDLIGFGYAITNHRRGDFEVEGISQQLVERFSKRHSEIDEKTRELLAREPDKGSGNRADIREHIAHNERSRKIKNVAQDKLRELWSAQMSDVEKGVLDRMTSAQPEGSRELKPADAAEAVKWAESHIFDRKSVVREHELWRHALERARGMNVKIEAVKAASAARDYIRNADDPRRVTTHGTLSREWEILTLAKNGIGAHEPLNAAHEISATLSDDQRQAATRILASEDFLSLFRGAAGTGKSFTLREVQRGLTAAGHHVRVVTPQRQQAIDLEKAGLTGVGTVSEFLARREMPRGGVVIIDEAGQLGARQMLELMRFVRDSGGRIICSGDTRQHGAVEASDALRAIEKYSGLVPAELTANRRQDPVRADSDSEREFVARYKHAVDDAAAGKVEASFTQLEENGAIVECRPDEQAKALAEAYLDLARREQSIVAVAQTWSQIHKVNEAVRRALKEAGMIADVEQQIPALETVDLTNAQKRDARFYDAEHTVVFNRKAAGFSKGQLGRVIGFTADSIVVGVG